MGVLFLQVVRVQRIGLGTMARQRPETASAHLSAAGICPRQAWGNRVAGAIGHPRHVDVPKRIQVHLVL